MCRNEAGNWGSLGGRQYRQYQEETFFPTALTVQASSEDLPLSLDTNTPVSTSFSLPFSTVFLFLPLVSLLIQLDMGNLPTSTVHRSQTFIVLGNQGGCLQDSHAYNHLWGWAVISSVCSFLAPNSTGKTPNVPRKPLQQSWGKNSCKCHFLPSEAVAALPILTSTTSKGLCFPRQIRFMQNIHEITCLSPRPSYLRSCQGASPQSPQM